MSDDTYYREQVNMANFDTMEVYDVYQNYY